MNNVIRLHSDEFEFSEAKQEILQQQFNNIFKHQKFVAVYMDDDGKARTFRSDGFLRIDDLAFMQKMLNKTLDELYPE